MKKPASVFTAIISSIALASCGGGGSGSTAAAPGAVIVAPTPTPTPSPTPTPTPTPPATSITPSGPPTSSTGFVLGTNSEAGYLQADPIATNFATAGMLRATVGATERYAEAEGAFRFLCKPSHLSYDDPIVYPGQKGKAHLHMFFGNTLADADSDYRSLRTTGDSTCNNALNRSAYWVPALMNGRGQAIMPEHISIYYKNLSPTHPHCKVDKCIGIPRGLRYVFGRTMDGKGDMRTYFACSATGADGTHYATLPQAAKGCPIGGLIGAVALAPPCWDGRHLDTPDHRSHMSNLVQDGFGNARCPSTHPYRIPAFQLGVWFKVDDTLDRSGNTSPNADTWYFSSDRMRGMTAQTSGSTFHADWYGAWDDLTLATWVENCIAKALSCSGGDLGNGTTIGFSDPYLRTYPRLVGVPADPKDTL